MIQQLFLLALLLCAASSTIFAVPVQWTFSGITFNDGGTASGTFVYDAATNTYSGINVTVTGGSLSSVSYIAQHPIASATVLAFLPSASGDLTGLRVLVLSPSGALTDSGGARTLVAALAEGPCDNATCTSATGVRSITAGSLTGSSVPTAAIPTVSTAMLAALAMLMAGAAWLLIARGPSESVV
jgi:hypothetical protein